MSRYSECNIQPISCSSNWLLGANVYLLQNTTPLRCLRLGTELFPTEEKSCHLVDKIDLAGTQVSR